MEETVGDGAVEKSNVALHQSIVLDVVEAVSPGGPFVLSLVARWRGADSSKCCVVAEAIVPFHSISKRKRAQEEKRCTVLASALELNEEQ
jgi:hypothetical protein